MIAADVLDIASPLTAAQFAAAVAEHERRAATLALHLRHLEASGEWAFDGSVSIAAWMREHCRMSNRAAHAWVRRGRLLDTYGAFAAAAVSGALSQSQVDALEHLHRPKYAEHLAEHQSALVEIVEQLSAADTETVCKRWRDDADAVIDEAAPPAEPERFLTASRDSEGALLLHSKQHGGAATEIEKALRNASTYEGDDDTRSHGERGADALFDIAAFYNKNHADDGTPRNLPHVSISVDESTIRAGRPVGVDGDTEEPMASSCTDTYLCDCKIHTILRDANGAPVGFGRSRYSVPRKLFSQVAARDGGCRFPGCDRKIRHCDAHHMRYWRHGGSTDYVNLVLLCSRHHHFVHQHHLQMKLDDHSNLSVVWRDGRQRTSRPRGAPPRHSRE